MTTETTHDAPGSDDHLPPMRPTLPKESGLGLVLNVLKELERWKDHDGYEYCPECFSQDKGHRPKCRISAAIRFVEGEMGKVGQ